MAEGAYAELGPIRVGFESFNRLKREIEIFCKGDNAVELLFAVIQSARTMENRLLGEEIVIVPTTYSDRYYVSLSHSLIEKLSKAGGLLAVGHVHTSDSVEPSDEDVASSVLIDRTVGRPVYHVIMNRDFEFEIYSNGEHVRHLHRPVSED